MSKKRLVTLEDLYRLKSVYDAQLSPDGNRVIYVLHGINKETEEYDSHLHMMNLETGESVQWTYGEQKDYAPKWSPEGNHVAFLSTRSGIPQIYVVHSNGGEARKLTDCKRGVSNIEWSPDGRYLLFSTKIKDHEEKEASDKLEPLVVDSLQYKSDASGFLKGCYSQIMMVEVETGEVTQLTTGPYHHTIGCWLPDQSAITFTANRAKNPGLSLHSDVFIYNLETKEMTNITNGKGFFTNVSASPDGTYLAMIGNEREYQSATVHKVWIYHLHHQSFTCLTSEWDVEVGDVMVGDLHSWRTNPGILWTSDSQGFYFMMSDQGNVGVYYGTIHGEMYPSLLEDLHVYSLSIHPTQHKAVIGISKPTHPGDLYTLNLMTGELVQITSVNKELMEEVELVTAEAFYTTAKDGLLLQSWLMKPACYEEGEKCPLILEIHGGPHMMYGNTFMYEFQLLAAKGYAVLFSNPRGGRGYGQAFVDAVRGDYGGMDYEDLMSVVDEAIDQYSFIDSNRLGVTGGSYGGFMTNWIVGQTNRFKAAVTQRCISNWTSFYGVSDIGYYFTEWEVKADIYEDVEKLWHHSPLRLVSNVETPLLILHSEKDYRCPIEQAEQLFIALKRKEKDVKFVRFPEANHELSRSGPPILRNARLNHITEWFDHYL
ncbi:alpha/beta hydrolase family protein [Metabacillus iocasae]|uniref:Dipeptidyl aminopeptidase/acylaminoacyl peptidase n=1 Tax=Priestia iocasae TaxID=2291674 RepID=A0ABS2QT73_9BACI|nr:S9 family peptidase [Metabacillus iocasae]MBM7702647.1 dipeptidyl aminopeptidase/acylaminoacyl peptidase [Metabacillus iocasae]